MNPARITRWIMLLLGTLVLVTPSSVGAQTVNDVLFTVASGDVSQDSIVLWAQNPNKGTTLTFTVFKRDISDPQGLTTSATVSDPMIPTKVRITGLQPGTRYEYRITDSAANTQQVGRFKTPAAAGSRIGLRFGVSGDWRQDLLPHPAIRNIPDRALDFFVALGDTIYADYPSDAVPVKQATTTEQFREKHHENLIPHAGENFWPAVRASTAFFATIDDHEVTNDFAGGALAGSDYRFPRAGKRLTDSPLYKNGLQAFFDYYPIESTAYTDSSDLTGGKPDLFRYRTFGDDAAIFMIDTRSFRSEPLPELALISLNDKKAAERYLTASFDPKRSLLGPLQMEKLQTSLLDSQKRGIRWKFILNPEPIQNLGLLVASDRWEGYAADRTVLLRFITDNAISNVVFITADFHGTIINDLYYQDGPGKPDIAANQSWEIITGAVAFAKPFGPTVFGLANAAGLVTKEQAALYNILPIAQKDQIIERLLDAQVEFFGYNKIGLEGSGLNVRTLKGGWVATHTYGWTEFEIDGPTGGLLVTTYGIPWYSAKQVSAEPARIAGLQPQIITQFSLVAR